MAKRPSSKVSFLKANRLSKKQRKLKNTPKMPTEAEIKKFTDGIDGLVGKETIARHFKLKSGQRSDLKKILQNMRRDGKLPPAHESKAVKKPAYSPASSALKPTSVLKVIGIDSDGEVKLAPVNWDEERQGTPPEIFLKETLKKRGQRSDSQVPALGEVILARLTPHNVFDNSFNARVLKKLDNNREAMFGVVHKSGAHLRITPTDKKSRQEFEVSRGHVHQVKPGDLVRFEIHDARARGLRSADILERLGNIDDHQNISLIALSEQGIPVNMPADVEAEAAAFAPFKISAHKNYTDMRHVPLITIDPPDARDHDDAVWAQADDDPKNPGGFKIIVAIADVACYVKPASKLDKEARKRGNSTYLPDRVVPMLPEKLSNELCSLKHGVVRPALACFMTFDEKGRKRHHHFDRITIKSAAKLSYKQAQDAIDGKPDDITAPLLEPILKPLWTAYKTLQKGRSKRQPLDLNLPERKLVLDHNGLVTDVKIYEIFEAHKLIEEFMIQANVAAAESLEKHKIPFIYRIHEAPSAEKLLALTDFLKTLNLSAPKGQVMKPANFNSILAKVAGGEYEHVVNQVVLRSQSQAVYTPQNLGHFGLNLRRYAHFTSPIRRYADLIVHRGLIRAFNLGKDGLTDNEISQLEEISDEISKTERRSMVAERDTKDRMIARFLAEKVDTTFSGRIGGLAGAGLFITLDETGADGFVPVATLEGDYFVHNEQAMSLVGERTGETYQIGDIVQVRLTKAAPVSGGLQMEMISRGREGKPAGRKKRYFSGGKVRGGRRSRR